MSFVDELMQSTVYITAWKSLEKLYEEEPRPCRPWLEVLASVRMTAPTTPRPTIDVVAAEVSVDRPVKEHPLLSASFWCDTIVDSFRQLQLEKIMRTKRCTYKVAVEMAEDPDPYDKEHLFHCMSTVKN